MQWYGSGAYVAKNCDATSLHELLHFLHQLDPICIEFCAVMKLCKCTPNITKHTRTWVWDPMVWIGCLRCEKFRRDFVARTFALIALVRHNGHRVSYNNKIVAKAPKHYETHNKIRLGSNGMDRVPSLRKITTPLRCTNFCIKCTSSARFAPSFIQ